MIEITRCERDDGDILWHMSIEEVSPGAFVFSEFIAEHVEKKVGMYVIIDTEW